MAVKAPINRTTGSFEDSPKQTASVSSRGARRLGAHAIELAELQVRLLAADAKAASRRLVSFVILALVGGVTLLAGTPVALHALGLYFSRRYDWSEAGGLAIAAGIAAVAGAILLLFAIVVVRSGIAKFNRSATELRQNLEMIKEMASHSSEGAEPH